MSLARLAQAVQTWPSWGPVLARAAKGATPKAWSATGPQLVVAPSLERNLLPAFSTAASTPLMQQQHASPITRRAASGGGRRAAAGAAAAGAAPAHRRLHALARPTSGCSDRSMRWQPPTAALGSSGGGTDEQQLHAARLHPLRLAPAPQLEQPPLRLARRRPHAVSPTWPQQSGGHDHDQQFSLTPSPPWYKFWMRRSSSSTTGSGSNGDGAQPPPAPLPGGRSSSTAHERELRAVDTGKLARLKQTRGRGAWSCPAGRAVFARNQ